MIWYVAKALLGLVATVLVAAVLIFGLARLTPGEASGSLGEWLLGILTGNFGASSSLNAPVGRLLAERLAVTLPLALLATVLTLVVGSAVGWLAGRHPGSWLDHGFGGLARLATAVPNFWLGMLLVVLFAATLRLLPPGGFVPWGQSPGGALASLLLPALALALPQAGVLALRVRDALADFAASDYFAALQGRGVARGEAVRRYGIRNALPAILQGLGPILGGLVAGTLVVENIFYLPGVGRLAFDALGAGDLPLLRGAVLIVVVLIAGTLFLIRLGRLWADPLLLLEDQR